MEAAAGGRTRVALFGDGFFVVAEVETGARRLSDLLNDRTRALLTVEQPRAALPDRPSHSFAEGSTGTVRKAALQAAFVLSETPRPPQQRFAAYVAKAPIRVALLLPALAVIGSVHLGGKIDPIRFVLDGPELFVAVTDAQVTPRTAAGAAHPTSLVLVNRARVETALILS